MRFLMPRRRKFSACGVERFGIDLVDGEKERLAGADEQAGEVDVGRSEFGAAVDDHDDGVGFIEGDPGLAKDF